MSQIGTQFSYKKLKLRFRKTNMGQHTVSYLGSSQWNRLPKDMKQSGSVTTFKHKSKHCIK